MTNNSLLTTVADTLLTLPYRSWDFGDSVAFEGMVAASDTLGDEKYLRFAQGWIRAWSTRALPYRRADCTAPGAAMVAVYRRTGDTRLLQAACELADYLAGRPRLDSGLFATWESSPLRHPYGPEQLNARGARLMASPPEGAFIDCLHFDPPFFVSLGVVTGDSSYVQTGVEQARAYIRRLQQDDGIFDHFELRGEPHTFGFGWGRGQGWALLGLVDVLTEVHRTGQSPATDLMTAVLALIDGMVDLQLPNGHWATNIRHVGSGIENSTAAFMAVGFRRALRLGLFDTNPAAAARVAAAADAAHQAVLASLSAAGTLSVSAAVMACTTGSHYENVPTGFTVPWGQGPVALMLAEEDGNG